MTARPSLPEAEWAAVKALWFAVQDAAPVDVERLLTDPTTPTEVRRTVRELLSAADRAGDRFETPAIVALGAPEPAVAPSLVGRRVGPFSVLRRLGQGGMGTVYEAERVDASYTQRVALKTLWRGADSEVLLQRFRSERQILASLRHPHIAQLLDGGATTEGTPWLALEYVDGVPIDEYCDAHRLDVRERLDLFRQVCSAVHFAHRNLVVHRDLKPSNVFVTGDGSVKLLDFGIAKLIDDPRAEGTLTHAGYAPYTAAYAAPEQVTGDPISTATDVYALGALLVHLLAGQPPLEVRALHGAALVARITQDPAPAPSVLLQLLPTATRDTVVAARRAGSAARLSRTLQGELDAIALMALRKEPDRRYASVDALSDDVHRYLRGARVLARPDTLGYRLSAFIRRHRALAAGTGVGLVVALAATVVWFAQARETRRESARSERIAQFMTRLVAASDPSASEAIVRIGPRGTLAQLLDGAIARVPREFADDPRSRARLYTAIGVNFRAQGRLEEAARVLDSAVVLSRVSYGERSEPFIAASIELAQVQFAGGGPNASRQTLERAFSALLGQERELPALHASALLTLGAVRKAEGAVRVADSLARRALALEALRTSDPSIIRARAELLLAATESWLVRDPRLYVRRCMQIATLTDSLDAQLSGERVGAVLCQVDGLLTLGRVERADSLLRAISPAVEAAYGASSLEMASLHANAANVAAARGDVPAQRALAQRAQRLLEASPSAAAELIVGVTLVLTELLRADGQVSEALRLALWARDRVTPHGVAVATIFANLTVANTQLALADTAASEAALLAGLREFPDTGDLDSMRPFFLRQLAALARRTERPVRADSLEALLPPRSAPLPDCTPGGRWLGCPLN